MSVEKWEAASDRGTVLSTQLNALADAAYSALGAELDNTANKDRFAVAELSVDFVSAPTAESVVELYCVIARDGTNYPVVAPPSALYYVGTFQIDDDTAAQLAVTQKFELPGPFKMKFLVRNRTGQPFPATGSTVKVSTYNREIL